MSVVVNIKQNSKKVKKIGLKFLSSWTELQHQYFGIPDRAYVLDTYKGEEDIRKQLFVLFDQKKYGRGMSFTVDENYNVEFVLNYPATRSDIEMFYKFLNDFCKNFKLDTFVLEGDECSLEQIPALKRNALSFNERLIKTYLKSGLTIFGCIYPIVIEESFIKKIKTLSDEDAYKYYEDYLDQKQKQDCYFAKPLIYNTSSKNTVAKYALTQDVPSIFPLEKYLPFGYNQNLKDEITEWSVVLVANHNEKLEVCEEIEYDEFCSLIHLHDHPRFDEKHVIVTFKKEWLSSIEQNKIEKAKKELEAWLEDGRELGKKPVKIEYTTSFIDEDGIRCHIFKYKKSLLSKWWQGIVSDSGVFSEMKEYNKATEIEDAKHTLNLLKEIWKKTARKLRS